MVLLVREVLRWMVAEKENKKKKSDRRFKA